MAAVYAGARPEPRAIAAPGIVDHHNHFGGAGGEGGFNFRTPPAQLSTFVKAGITTAVGLLGTDGYSRSLTELLAKAPVRGS